MSATYVTVVWKLDDSIDTSHFERLMRRSKRGLVTSWDDGRGRDMWYQAKRGGEERTLREKCVAAIGAKPHEILVSTARDAGSER